MPWKHPSNPPAAGWYAQNRIFYNTVNLSQFSSDFLPSGSSFLPRRKAMVFKPVGVHSNGHSFVMRNVLTFNQDSAAFIGIGMPMLPIDTKHRWLYYYDAHIQANMPGPHQLGFALGEYANPTNFGTSTVALTEDNAMRPTRLLHPDVNARASASGREYHGISTKGYIRQNTLEEFWVDRQAGTHPSNMIGLFMYLWAVDADFAAGVEFHGHLHFERVREIDTGISQPTV